MHERMPVIIAQTDYEEWLDSQVRDGERLKALLRPFPVEEMEAYPVSLRVNNPAHDDEKCIAPRAISSSMSFSTRLGG